MLNETDIFAPHAHIYIEICMCACMYVYFKFQHTRICLRSCASLTPLPAYDLWYYELLDMLILIFVADTVHIYGWVNSTNRQQWVKEQSFIRKVPKVSI